jgi:tRNA threonylcarbamoyladenosine biosynthesis protein TsaE
MDKQTYASSTKRVQNSHNAAETLEIGRRFAASLQAGEVLALSGDLGAGKTHFVKGLALGLGVTGEVSSPTFTLIHEYPGGRLPLYHVDFYRLEETEEAVRIGIEDYLNGDGVTAIEWAEKFPDLIPAGARWIRFRLLENDRREIELP